MPLIQYPSVSKALKANCQRSLGWRKSYTNRVCVEYCKFLILKVKMKDFGDDDGNSATRSAKLTPSLAINKMWEQHVLDSRQYYADCHAFCGRMIHHSCDVVDQDVTLRRVKATKRAYELVFRKRITSEIWDFGVFSDESNQSRRRNRDQLDDESDGRYQNPVSTPAVVLNIAVRDEHGNTTLFRVRENMKFSKVFDRFAEKIGIEEAKLKFSFDDHRLHRDFTPVMLKMTDGDVIKVRTVKARRDEL